MKKSNAMVPALLVLGALLIATDVVWTFTLAPLVQGARLSESVVIAGQMVTTKLLLSQKIFYLHVPVAIASFVFMGVAAYHALRFLVTKDLSLIHILRLPQLRLRRRFAPRPR